MEAFLDLLRHLRSNTGMAFVCIQHLDPKHESMLASILAKSTAMPVLEVTDEMPVKPDHVYVIPPNTCMTISGGVLKLTHRLEKQAGINKPIDVFLDSLAQDRGSRAIGIILSGTASDGSAGIRAIKEEGGITFAQDEKSAKFEQMPQNAVATGCVDFILKPESIAESLEGISRHPHANPSEIQIQKLFPETAESFREILLLLKKVSGVDFLFYKPATIKRRIVRRMVLNRKKTLEDYLAILKKNPEELETLNQDVLIKVTRFFRDPEIFKALDKDVFPHIAKNKSNDAPLRIWVPACSTGEEVYSLAIALLEHMGDEANHIPIQFFGSDVKDGCIESARAGIYSQSIVQDVSEERLKRFFNKIDRGYQITKLIRDRCVFAKQNVTADPPFSRIDFISCRNLLIYLTPALQNKVIPTFHYALNPGGFLLLGHSETIMNFPDLFKSVNPKARIYSKKPAQSRRAIEHFVPHGTHEKFPLPKKISENEESRVALNAQREADRVVVARYEQAGVVVNEALEILQFRGDTSYYLKQPSGKPSLNVLRMAREGLLTDLRMALDKAMKDGQPFKKEDIRIKLNGGFKTASIEVVPLKVPGTNQKHFLISFAEMPPAASAPHAEKSGNGSKSKPGSHERELEDELSSVKEELASTKIYMQSVIEEREVTNTELQAANEEVVTSNEELQSLNEEMQSANEELQTAKEELQASNEEITTVNDELNGRNAQLTQLNDDFVNLINSIQLPVVIVGSDLRIRRFTPEAEKIFSLVATDVGRSIEEIKLKIKISNLGQLISNVVKNLAIKEEEVQGERGNWYNMQVRPYRTSDNKIDGIVMTFSDIDALKKNQQIMKDQTHYLDAVIQTVPTALVVLDAELRVQMVNQCFCRTFHVNADQSTNRHIYELGDGQWNIPSLRRLLEDVLPGKRQFFNYEVVHDFEHIGAKTMLLNASQIDSLDVILLSVEDVTDAKQREKGLRELNTELEKQGEKMQSSNVELERFAAVASHDLREPFQTISNFMGLLASSYKDKLDPKAQEFIKIAEDAAGRAQNLITSLLDYARIDTQNKNLEPIEMETIVTQVLADLRHLVEESSAEIACDPLPKITGDRLQLSRLFQNLISNAIKYRNDRPLKIHISARKEKEAWIFSVRDNGLGFDPKDTNRIFDMFKRLVGREISGVGIGLAVCKKIVEQHGGKIWAESTPSKGSTFYFSIPEQINETEKEG